MLVKTDTFNDTTDEPNETFTLSGTLTSNGAPYSDSGIATIIDNDTPTITVGDPANNGIGDITVPEGDDAIFGVNLTGVAVGGTLTLTMAQSGVNPATEGTDYKVTTFQYSLDNGTTGTTPRKARRSRSTGRQPGAGEDRHLQRHDGRAERDLHAERHADQQWRALQRQRHRDDHRQRHADHHGGRPGQQRDWRHHGTGR
ncbi:MAG: hypothetical protein IPG66_01465 [Hydrogenophilales bacterium]|nr:hypothetical protein [Hydrogenophilales bacterium]